MSEAQAPKAGLSPPWWTLYNKIANTIGKDPSYTVEHMQEPKDGSTYTIIIKANSGSEPAALSAILNKSYPMGNITVNVVVRYTSQIVINVNSPGSLAGAVRMGLRTNPYFVEAVETAGTRPPGVPVPSVEAVFKPEVIQFFNDDLSDYYGNYNGIAAKVFAEILKADYGNNVTLGTTTQEMRAQGGGAQGGGAQGGGAQGGSQG